MKHNIFLGIGTNLGDRLENLHKALQAIQRFADLKKVSSTYETEPWGYTEQPTFLNQVLAASTMRSPFEVLNSIKSIEGEIGRTPTFRYGPRIIDIDILFYDNILLEDARLILPHPHITERAFVMVPLDEIAPNYIHPALQLTIHELIKDMDTSGVKLFPTKSVEEDA
ncbi:MAG TPA: 2-amino-4-hydroxy-6-hydroxymethyldihydropteridine diphosphokinase [Anaerolineaceae bacterium]|nr:2-amino-4-hydroxy-6-hydroxymethyldihydropteridine diphosphokinase [Anaerolineaceae bacterium]